ncbi:DEAD/DEAH box helicase [Caldimonas caldifontis]|nr:DEAD/DEAH box helicase [Caldimonas caldifontis]
MPPSPAGLAPVPGHFQPRLTLQTLGQGDGLLGLRPEGPFGPRGEQVTVAWVDWTYTVEPPGGGAPLRWEAPAPTRALGRRAEPVEVLRGAWGVQVAMARDAVAEADAIDVVRTLGLRPLPEQALQWRHREAAAGVSGPLWSLVQEAHFADLWADEVPRLQAMGWRVVVRPGFAHESVPVTAWRMVMAPGSGEPAREPKDFAPQVPSLDPLGLPRREGSWLLSLGVEVDGQTLDLAPLVADLLRRDKRWLHAEEIAAIDDAARIRLRAPGGRRIEMPAAPLKAIVGAMVDLLVDRDVEEGPLVLSAWDAHRIESLQAQRAGADGAWALQGDTGLAQLAQRLRDSGGLRPVPPPTGLGLTLRPYQLQGLAWLQYLREQRLAGILADDMGLGKTAQTLAHLLVEQQAGRLDVPALVVLPTSLLFNWRAEARRIAPALRVLVLHGAQRHRHFERLADHDLVLTTYPLLWRDIDTLAGQAFHTVILDEAQTVKNAGSRAARALRRLRSRHRLALTGTPLENHLGDLWAHFDFLMPGFLGDARHFVRHWRKPIETHGETLRAQLLAQRVRPFILRRRKDDVAPELPPKTEVIRRVALQGRQRELYESVRVAADEQVRRALKRSGFDGAQISILDALLKLRQACNDPRLLKRVHPGEVPPESAKREWLREMLPELIDEGRRVLLFSQFTEMLGLIEEDLAALHLPWVSLTGDTPPAQRGEVVRRFQDREVPLMLLSLKAGGVGLNLTAADTVIHVDPWWNPAVEEQATARAHRIGQDQPVFVYKLVAEGSIEERMLALQARKTALAEGVLGRDAAEAAKFGPDDLEGLLAPLPADL